MTDEDKINRDKEREKKKKEIISEIQCYHKELFMERIVYALELIEKSEDTIDPDIIEWAISDAEKENVSRETRDFLKKTATKLKDVGYESVGKQFLEIANALPLLYHTNQDFKKYLEEYDLKSMLSILDIGITSEGGYSLQIPRGTFNVIGARPGNGKTTALISIANENLLNIKRAEENDKNKNGVFKSIIFISLEEDENDIHRKLIFCRMFRENHREKDHEGGNYIEPSKNITQDFWEYQGKGFAGKGSTSDFFYAKYEKARKEIADAIDNKELKIYDCTNRHISRIKAIMESNPESLVLLDYIQLVKPLNPTSQVYKEIQDICVDIFDTAKETKCTVIAGAQLNRAVPDDPEEIGDNLFREGDDILTCANTAIVFHSNKEGLFWKIIKNRNGGGKGTYAMLHTEGMAYSCIWNSREPVVALRETKVKNNKKQAQNKSQTTDKTKKRNKDEEDTDYMSGESDLDRILKARGLK